MAYFFFIDESGYDLGNSPCAVLASVAVEDRNLWNLIKAIKSVELKYFGQKYTAVKREIKAKKFLRKKDFRLAKQLPTIPDAERTSLAQQCLTDGGGAGKRQLTALAQAKISYVKAVLELCSSHHCKFFASIMPPTAFNRVPKGYLRKDYTYLFERFFYFLDAQNDNRASSMGVVVFDELEKTQCHLLVDEMERYFKQTEKGKLRARWIIPEPLFVHSDLTTGVQIADLAAYIISWAWKFEGAQPNRPELGRLMQDLMTMRHQSIQTSDEGQEHRIWSFVQINDLRPKDLQRNEGSEKGNRPARL